LKYSGEGVELLASKHGREAIDVIAKLGEDGIKGLKFNDELLSKYSKLDDIEKFAAETSTLAKELVWYDKSTHLSNALKYNDDIYEVIERYKDNLPELIKGIREVARRYGFEPKF